jgi:LuxR family maltose regulon positive regulatory protein
MSGTRNSGPLLIRIARRAEGAEPQLSEPRATTNERTGDPVLTLKILPPRPRKNVLPRPRLDRPVLRQADVPVAIVEAPTGYGKTLLLAQWRRAAMAEGAAGAWLKLDEQDDARRLLHGIAMSMRQATGRPGFAAGVESWQPDADWPLNAAAGLLAEWSQLAHPVVLILDDFERLTSPEARVVAHYLIANLPPNGRIFLGARAISDRAWLMEQQAYGRLVLIGRSELAFTLEESVAFLKERLPTGLSSNIAAQLHERTGGWPVGLELFVATLDRTKETPSVLSLIHTGSRRFAGTIIDEGFRSVARYVVKSAVAARPAVMEKFLIEISILDRLNPRICTEVTRRADAGELIAQLRQATPLVVDREDGWSELHHIAAAYLREQAAALPPRRRRSLHARAASWLMRHQCWEEATGHAFEAGNEVAALDCIEKCAGALLASGNIELLDSWFNRLPGEEIRKRPLLRRTLAFRMAIKCVPEHAALVEDLASSTEPQERFTAAVIRALGAMHVDDPDAAASILAEWREHASSDDPVLLRTYYNVRRWLDGLDGRPRKYRQWGEGASPVLGHAAFAGAETLHAHAVNYLNNGQPLLASRLLVPALARFEESFGRRSTPALMTAITLAAVANELDDLVQVRTLMADRLDRVDPPLLPELMSMGYIAMANLVLSEGQANRALDHLEFLFERAQASAFPRIQAIAAVELVKFHTGAGRIEPCQRLLLELESIARRLQERESLHARPVLLLLHLARARTSWAERDAQSAYTNCESAIEVARSIRNRRLEFEARLLRSAILHDRASEISPDLAEVACLARDLRLNRMIREAAQFLDPTLLRAIQVPAESEPRAARLRGPESRRARASWDSSAMMTARECEVLRLLSRGMSNKEIAIALDIGAGTIKWHLKNLFLKVQATDRKQAVARARLLGLID